MSTDMLSKMLAVAVVLLVVDHFVRWLSHLWNPTAGALGALGVVAVTFSCSRLARSKGGHVGFFLLPTLLFAVMPATAEVWAFFTAEKSGFDRVAAIAPFLVFFVVPLGLLLFVWAELKDRIP